MGSSNFFAHLAAMDPIVQSLDLPGAHKYAQAQAQDVQTNPGPYAGVTPTLAAANTGYALHGPGAVAGWTPNQGTSGGGLETLFQHGANFMGNTAGPQHDANALPSKPGMSNLGSTQNPYVTGNGNQGGW